METSLLLTLGRSRDKLDQSQRSCVDQRARLCWRKASKDLFMRLLICAALALGLTGCLAKTAIDVVTLPVKVASAGVDAVTTSQKEADEKRGRRVREHEECMGKEARKAEKEQREADYSRCPDPDARRR
jgi:hypothetical protein